MSLPGSLIHPLIQPIKHRIIKRSILSSWSRTAIVYHIYVQSFKDSNNDGIGDLQGIIDTLDYLHDGTTNSLGVNTLWLSPIWPSPMKDQGYDPSNHYAINPLFGDLKTFDRLIAEAHWRGIKVVMDFVENHTSEEHPWFRESKKSRDNNKSDWYIWKDPAVDGGPPNNWLSVFGGSAWEYEPSRRQYYLHSFLKEQPDLNWRNAEVVKEMKHILRFWIDRGVDGFRCDAANHLIKDSKFRDEPLNPDYVPGTTKPWYQYQHPYMRNRPETPLLLGHLADFAKEFGDIFFISEANITLEQMREYYDASQTHRLMPFNFATFKLPWEKDAYQELVQAYEKIVKKYDLPNYVFGNHDRSRLMSRLGKEKARIIALLSFTLHGMPFIYQGDELGMTDTDIPEKKSDDPFGKDLPELSRDPSRTPMQWNKQKNAGFSNHTPWLPVNDNYKKINVQEEYYDPTSLLTLYKQLIHLRNHTSAFQSGAYHSIETHNPHVYGYTRSADKTNYVVLINFSNEKVIISPDAGFFAGRLLLSTHLDKKPTDLYLQDIPLRAYEGVIIKL